MVIDVFDGHVKRTKASRWLVEEILLAHSCPAGVKSPLIPGTVKHTPWTRVNPPCAGGLSLNGGGQRPGWFWVVLGVGGPAVPRRARGAHAPLANNLTVKLAELRNPSSLLRGDSRSGRSWISQMGPWVARSWNW